VRTTVSIGDDVLRSAKQRAADEGITLSELITEALRQRLVRRPCAARDRFAAVTWGEGGTLPGVDITHNAAVRDLTADS
jgi:hypothetical protein